LVGIPLLDPLDFLFLDNPKNVLMFHALKGILQKDWKISI
jgi:hypothetical protein